MKLNLKSGEHIRIEHDSKGQFRIWIEDGAVHVTAMGPEEKLAPTIVTNKSDVRLAHAYL